MANPNPSRQGDYRDIDPKGVKVWTREVLIWLVLEEPSFPSGSFTSLDVAAQFGRPVADASCRLGKLRNWHCIKILKRGAGRKPHQYIVTAWGQKMAQKWAKEG